MTYKPEELLHVNYLWKDKEADKLNPLERSEEHTSELQSRSDLVCRLLLEKKKEKKKKKYHNTKKQ